MYSRRGMELPTEEGKGPVDEMQHIPKIVPE